MQSKNLILMQTCKVEPKSRRLVLKKELEIKAKELVRRIHEEEQEGPVDPLENNNLEVQKFNNYARKNTNEFGNSYRVSFQRSATALH